MSEIQAGRQKGRVVSARLDTTQSGKPYVRVTFALDGGGEIAADVWLTTPKALSMARARLRCLGFDVDLANLDDLQREPCPIAGAEAVLDIQEETYNGQTALKVVWFGKERKPLVKTKCDELTRLMRAAKTQTDEVPPEAGEAGADSAYPF
jgi:hypothetical protein